MVTDGDGVGERTPKCLPVNNWFYRESATATRSATRTGAQQRNTGL